ncbi:DUF1643 domain-containing protein [Actinobacillus equuli subsp. equuli]|uniref:DUF1643 domain-containing protein n=1 Tax=Actinobacillus equuli TaxID=718 RepID=UPI0024428691|nr:DUF1643 domain-containing protein [Actinobacillus equuli]WGE55084.1 DUF1643 domain-containing protein [Actinobacillus equuli subsp. equuli]
MLESLNSGAELSECRKYRYALWRVWDKSKPKVMFIGLNPSTADDNTITRCINFAKSWGYGGIYMTNLFAYRSTDKSQLYRVDDPIGVDNDEYIAKYADLSEKVIAAWGNDGAFLDRSKLVANLISPLFCLEINKTGEPKHPLYVRADMELKEYKRS